MVKNTKWPIKTGVLKNFEEYLKVYDIEQKKETTFTKEKIDNLIPTGTYVIKMGTIIAVFRKSNSLYLGFNNDYLELPTGKYSMEVSNQSETTRKFTIAEGKINVLEFVYDRQTFVNFDPWSDEDDVDFFVWLSSMYYNGRLLNMYV